MDWARLGAWGLVAVALAVVVFVAVERFMRPAVERLPDGSPRPERQVRPILALLWACTWSPLAAMAWLILLAPEASEWALGLGVGVFVGARVVRNRLMDRMTPPPPWD
jgi:hypothetical protein